jgi:hypothetical protein
MTSKWTPDNERDLLLIVLAHYIRAKTNNGPLWNDVAKLLGQGFTDGAISQHYSKKLVKREAFVRAKEWFAGGALSVPSTPTKSPTKKRKADDMRIPKQEPEAETLQSPKKRKVTEAGRLKKEESED